MERGIPAMGSTILPAPADQRDHDQTEVGYGRTPVTVLPSKAAPCLRWVVLLVPGTKFFPDDISDEGKCH